MRDIARRLGVQLSFKDAGGRRRGVTGATLSAVMEVLEADTAPRSLAEPVAVAWEGGPVALLDHATSRLDCTLVTDDGRETSWAVREGEPLTTPHVPLGYYTLHCDDGRASHRTRIIAAPRHAPVPTERLWGVFLPLYALRTARSWGAGDLTDLGSLIEWVESLGGDFVGTLPLLSTFLGEPYDPSPYAPVSRLFWNELYVDPEDTPEWRGMRPDVDRLAKLDVVDYREIDAVKRRVLEELSARFHASPRRSELDRFLAEHPHAEAYARFRAEKEGDNGPAEGRAAFSVSTSRLRSVETRRGLQEEAFRVHLYAQLVAEEQLRGLGRRLELDLPIGVHPEGFDVEHFDVFARGVSAGAPPDAFFSGGQNWGFPPLHPVKSREDGHAYFAESIRTLARHASVLRIDHVMGLTRLYWIPEGAEATRGTYVRYPAEELYAVVTLEAHRNGTAIVGEDLGTVPREVRSAMKRHRLLRSYVLQFEASDEPVTPVPVEMLASLNTHDTQTFAQFAKEHPELLLDDALAHLAASRARAVVVNLEDLWGEDRPQNVPGTTSGNWERKAALDFEQFSSKPEVLKVLRSVDEKRKT